MVDLVSCRENGTKWIQNQNSQWDFMAQPDPYHLACNSSQTHTYIHSHTHKAWLRLACKCSVTIEH